VTAVRVLIVDDSAAFLEAAIEVVVATPGFEVVGASSSAEQGLELVSSTRPDLVLMDVRMPGLDGIETAHRIRAQSPDTIVVLVTADSGSSVEHGPFSVLSKRTLSPARLAEAWSSATA
jgi:DNA-binding NarL/FixJ family response regulator